MANEKRNASIDITKFILALIVVMLHSATECLGTEHMAVRVIEYSGRFVVQSVSYTHLTLPTKAEV